MLTAAVSTVLHSAIPCATKLKPYFWSAPMRLKSPGQRGFNLIELVFAMAVVGVLAGLGLPSFIETVRKTRRVEAIDALQRVQLAQEKWRANNTSYGTLGNLGISATTSGGYYTLSLSNVSGTGYAAVATAVAGKSQTADKAHGVSCAALSVNQDGPVYSPAAQSACWVR